MNKFKVGDKVRIYHDMGNDDGVITSIEEDFLSVNLDCCVHVGCKKDHPRYHYKCCRKLVKKKKHV